MNRNDDFDKTLEAWLHRLAPPQAPDRVLDAALERVAAQSQKRSWLQRLIGETPMALMTRAAAAAAVIAIAALIGFQFSNLFNNNVGNSPSPSASVPADPTPSASPDPSPSPSEALPSALVLRLEGGTVAGRVHAITVLDDGRVVSSGLPGTGDPIVERRLTAAGVQLIRDELDATGLTDTSAAYDPVPNPGVEPPVYGGAGPSLEVGQPGGGTALITWFLFGDTEQDYFQPQREAETLEALYARLVTLDEWLPASAWADATPSPYSPADYRIFISRQQWGGSLDDLPVESSTVPWPLDGAIESFGEPMGGASQEPDTYRCGVITADQAAAVIEALEVAGATPSEGMHLSSALGDRANSRVLTIILDPILPLDETGCEGATFPF